MEVNRIVTYSLLAHINDHDKGIKDLNDIFIPLVKRVLFQLSQKGTVRGLLPELKNEVDAAYSFDIPFPILRKIVTKIANEANKEVANDFQFFKDGSFLMSKFVFADYEEIVRKQQAEVDSLSNTYEQYLLANNINVVGQPSVFEFLDRNRSSLSTFFAAGKAPTLEPSFYVQAKFVADMKRDPFLYGVLRKVYLGSIITSYLELDFGEPKNGNVEFLLDSSFLIHLLDLSSTESTHTCRTILEICQRLKYRVSVLDFTVDETEALLKRKAENVDSRFLARELDESSIYSACARRGLGRTDLLQIAAKLGESISHEYGIYIIPNSTALRNKAKYSSEYEQLKNRAKNPDGAWHDATAIIYVQEHRKKRVRTFYEATCWFVTDAKQDIALTRRNDGTVSEMIRPEELVNVLWLTNPRVKSNEITDIGLTRLVASTISDSLPSPRVLKEFDENLQKYSQGKLTPEDVIRLGHMIANKSLNNLERLNDIAVESPAQFVEELSRHAKRAKVEEDERERRQHEMLIHLRKNYETKLREREESLHQEYQEGIRHAQQAQSEQAARAKSRELDMLREELSQNERTHLTLLSSKEKLDKAATADAQRILMGSGATVIGIPAILTLQFGWNVMEPWTYFGSLGILVGEYFWFAWKKGEMSPPAIWRAILSTKTAKRYTNAGFDVGLVNGLGSRIDTLRKRIAEMEEIGGEYANGKLEDIRLQKKEDIFINIEPQQVD